VRRRSVAHKRSLLQFHDGLAWLMQIAMFLILGLQVFPARLLPIAGVGLLVALFLIFVARPLSVHIALLFSNISFPEQMLVAWVGLRGAVPIVLATFPLLAGIHQADTIFHLVFFIALTSVLVQGPPIPWIARKLQLDRPPSSAPVDPLRNVPSASPRA
jgi:cell volume regulation protein A